MNKFNILIKTLIWSSLLTLSISVFAIDDVPTQNFSKKNDAKRFCPAEDGDPDKVCNVCWTYKFDWSIVNDEIIVKVNVFLKAQPGVTADELATKKTDWEKEIEDTWSKKAKVIKTAAGVTTELPIITDVCFIDEEDDAHFVVKVFETLQRESLTRWSCTQGDGTAAHEFGHMLGAFDEYKGGKGFRKPSDVTETPPGENPTDTKSIMGTLSGNVFKRHYDCVVEAVDDFYPPACTFTSQLITPDPPAPPSFIMPLEGDYDIEIFEITCPESVPTLSQWGIIILILLLFTFGCVSVIRARQTELSIAGGGNLNIKTPLFNANQFGKTVLKSVPYLMGIIVIISIIENGLFVRNIIGTVFSGLIISYLIHFILLTETEND